MVDEHGRVEIEVVVDEHGQEEAEEAGNKCERATGTRKKRMDKVGSG